MSRNETRQDGNLSEELLTAATAAVARPDSYREVINPNTNEAIANTYLDTKTDKYYWYDQYANTFREIDVTNDSLLVRGARAITNVAQHPRIFQVGMAGILCMLMYQAHSITKNDGSVPTQLDAISSDLNATSTKAQHYVDNIRKGYDDIINFVQMASILLLSSSLAYSLKTWAGSIKSNYHLMKKMNSGLLVLGATASLAVLYFGLGIPGSAVGEYAHVWTLKAERSLLDNNSALYPIANAGLTLLATFIAAGAFNLGGLLAREERAQAAGSFVKNVGAHAFMGARSSLVSARNALTLSQGLDSLSARVKRLENNEQARKDWIPVADPVDHTPSLTV